ncbi:hypothetical protein BABINDRAFT_160194 [Babjeviella inositovora NRRL Y-12698]|uniref:Dynein heavy chain, cytoplasmic n=1 Tax=Babjeviella inositovora NRRL Y-12698 TaxID=984486 RepID=A0A1E3QWC0_9ASCO|nr:uncharacterized protein BABINDRAFT_160194 [Babjeviella inositovora NRRL Y-12698]ODQ81979.1 hypothetical protein BABINDRAFT_160194 [Babjeviella inositovora NRRL Y-12698]
MSAEPEPLSPKKLGDFAFNLAQLLQGATKADVVWFHSVAAVKACAEFAEEPAPATLFVIKHEPEITDSELEGAELEVARFTIASTLTPNASSLALIKGRAPLTASPLDAQIQVVNIPHLGSSFENLRSLVSLGLAPYFEAVAQLPGREEETSIGSTRKKISELALSLQYLQQNIQVADLTLSVHPAIRQAIATADGPDYLSSIPSDLLSDSNFLNGLQTIVNGWVKATRSVTRLTHDPSNGSTSDEVNFWLSMETALASLQQQLYSPEVQLTLDVLKHAKRFHATVSFLSDTGIKEATQTAQTYTQLLRDLPIGEVLSASSLTNLDEAILLVFGHLKRLRVSQYPLDRAITLVETILADVDAKLKQLIRGEQLMELEHADFTTAVAGITSVFSTFDSQMKDFASLARELLRKRSEKYMYVKVLSKTDALAARIVHVSAFRARHEELLAMVSAAFAETTEPSDISLDVFASVDVADTSAEGNRRWNAAEKAYQTRAARMESAMIATFKRELAASGATSNEMFAVFEKFAFLLARPAVRSAVHDYQSQLLAAVETDIHSLQAHFAQQGTAAALYRLRDLPPITAAISWAKQIEHKVDKLVDKLELVLGPSWTSYAEGQRIHTETSVFRRKLDTQALYDHWVQAAAQGTIQGPVLQVVKGKRWALAVNFDESIGLLFKEVRNLCWLGYAVPHAVVARARTVRKIYPEAISLREALHTFTVAVVDSDTLGDFRVVVASSLAEIYALLERCLLVTWEDLARARDLSLAQTDLDLVETQNAALVQRLVAAIGAFYEMVEGLKRTSTEVARIFEALMVCEYEIEAMASLVASAQKVIDNMILDGSLNVALVVARLNARLAHVFTARCTSELEVFMSEIATGYEKSLFLAPSRHEILLHDQKVVVLPPIEHSRYQWTQGLHRCVGVVCAQKTIHSVSFDVRVANPAAEMFQIDVSPVVNRSLQAIQLQIVLAERYVARWLQLQKLWDLESGDVSSHLGTAVEHWIQVLLELQRVRQTFDTAETSETLGAMILDYDQAQSRVNAKYDIWHRQLIAKFAEVMSTMLKETDSLVVRARKDLEVVPDFTSTPATTALISHLAGHRASLSTWTTALHRFQKGQLLLSRNRFRFPSDWLHAEQMESDLAALAEIIDKRTVLVDSQMDVITTRIQTECARVQQLMVATQTEWNTKKPVSGKLEPRVALGVLDGYEARLEEIQAEKQMLVDAAALLSIDVVLVHDFSPVLEETRDLRSVWSSIDTLWKAIQDLRAIPWTSVQPRALRRQLEELLAAARNMPARIRQYHAFETIQESVKAQLKANAIVGDLSSEALQPRHWKKLFSLLSDRYIPLHNMKLGDVWDLHLLLNEAEIRATIAVANGEKTLEHSLALIEEAWANLAFDLVGYQNRCRLVKNWEVLIQRCDDDLGALTSMKHSPYYKAFEEEALSWESKLNRLYVLLDVWIDTQRQWIYLDGVFGENDISRVLPTESARFQNVSAEFMLVLKSLFQSPFAIHILNVANAQSNLERTLDSLTRVRKALNDYLEKQREIFPRFYFIGNEDLLDIIGNASNVTEVGRHLQKMFPGIASIAYDKQRSLITAIHSEEGETVILGTPVSIAKHVSLHQWLKELEYEVKCTLSNAVFAATTELRDILYDSLSNDPRSDALTVWIARYPGQALILASQVCWTTKVEECITRGDFSARNYYVRALRMLAGYVLLEANVVTRKKIQTLIIELIHQRDIIDAVRNVRSVDEFAWRSNQLFHYDVSNPDPVNRLTVVQANATFVYGFEYLGVPGKLVYTPLVDKCFLTMTQALNQRRGGSPFGPAGTGKTESIKALGHSLGKMVLVFCCDESFDFQAMSRIFVGICEVGVWGCFDEFNRLEENMLSAVSTQIEKIELGLASSSSIQLVNRPVSVHPETGIFITMNPGYAGRSTLPENLKKLFRSFSMEKPDREIIAEVILNSQGFTFASELAARIVPFFQEMEQATSTQLHYDFGLRALKSTLLNCGKSKRQSDGDELVGELSLVLGSMRESVAAKLVTDDEVVMRRLENEHFPEVQYAAPEDTRLIETVREIALASGYATGDEWMKKILQLKQLIDTHHGVMMVGKAACGKTVMWKTLLAALSQLDQVDSVHHIIDCKVLSKDDIYGCLHATTRDWTDGLLTGILRRVTENLRGELSKRIWIVFDGDVDPEWVENLNSVLDDNKLLTLPNGERLALPSNVRLLFEVDNLKHATPATVSRCGMLWMSERSIVPADLLAHYMVTLRTKQIAEVGEEQIVLQTAHSSVLAIQNRFADHLRPFMDGVILECLEHSARLVHIMGYDATRLVMTFATMMNTYCRRLVSFVSTTVSFLGEDWKAYTAKAVLLSLVWAFAGDCSLEDRESYSKDLLGRLFGSGGGLFDGMNCDGFLLDHDISLPGADWVAWKVPVRELAAHSIVEPDVIVPTLDTTRHEDLFYSLLAEHRPFILCGPPGSGKTMTLLGALRKSPHLEVLGLNFSKETSPAILLKSIEQHCEYKKTAKGTVLTPRNRGKWLVVFCDEINLPAADSYGNQRVASFMRQLIEQNGFWRNDKQWISLSCVQFVGACNPSTDPGRRELSPRFLRHMSLVMVDYPGKTSLTQIYTAFNAAVLKCAPNLIGFADSTTGAMLDVYFGSRARFTMDIQPHYIYSPRELTRWVRGIYEAIKATEELSLASYVRLLAHEALRLFSDRLVDAEGAAWTMELLRAVFSHRFPNLDIAAVLQGPILYTDWLSLTYQPADRDQLRVFVQERLRTFSEEELDVSLVLYDDLLDHVLRIDRVLRQPQGHLILVGPSSSGKTTLSRFVSWVNGLKVFQMNVHRKYSLKDFDTTLQDLLRRSGAYGEKICFIVDESNILETAFLERMNNLLANSEVPGLFEGEDFAALMAVCKDEVQNQGLLLDTQEELYRWFTQQVAENLHLVFTINDPNNPDSPQIISSPALFNRCVLNWMGDWSDVTLGQVARDMLQLSPIDSNGVADAMVDIHRSRSDSTVTPGFFIQFIRTFKEVFKRQGATLEDHQRHVNMGLDKLRETVLKVKHLKESLSTKKESLTAKESAARSMLSVMLNDQNEAERRQEASLDIQAALEKQEVEISQRRELVIGDLELAEPAVLEALRGVKNIKKQHLTEIRSMSHPPEAVKVTMESVCILLGYEVLSWRDVQTAIRRDDFIASIVNYENEKQLTAEIRTYMERTYLSRADFNFATVNRASKACGPLLQWILANLTYSAILDRVGPLREEVYLLEEHARKNKAKLLAIEEMIEELEGRIEQYKDDYGALIRDAENIKTEMSGIEHKVERSMRLLESLGAERQRWGGNIKEFVQQRQYLVGNALLASAFVVYCGYFDQRGRSEMVKAWRARLATAGITYEEAESVVVGMSTNEEVLKWQEHGLENDQLYIENMVAITNTDLVPFIIDPSGAIVDVLMAVSGRMSVASFLDDGFVKQLENALRFGGTLLLQDGEHFDPVVSRIINKEFQTTGGRTLVNVGKQLIDCSPDFKLYIHTKDPRARIPSFLLSRVTVANFSVTRSSLETKVLNMTLRNEHPEIEEKRVELLKLHGEYRLRLRVLEETLLVSLSDSTGNILDNSQVLATLETLKSEATQINQKMVDTADVMQSVDETLGRYSTLAAASSGVFALFEQFASIDPLYQFSLPYFVGIFERVLRTSGETGSELSKPIDLNAELFREAFAVVSLSLKREDRITMALCMFILSHSVDGYASFAEITAALMRIIADGKATVVASLLPVLKAMSIDARETTVEGLFSQWSEELFAQFLPDDDLTASLKPLVRAVMLVKANPRVLISAYAEVCLFLDAGAGPFDSKYVLDDVVRQHAHPLSPIILCTQKGVDPTFRVDRLAKRLSVKLSMISMGSNEGIEMAKKEIGLALRNGHWVLIQNVQMAPAWLEYLEKYLEGLTKTENFRLFLTCDVTSSIPNTLLRSSRVVLFETSPGVKSAMTESVKLISQERLASGPVEKSRLYFLLAWFHSLVQERVRLAPVGFSKTYDFNDTDFETAMVFIDNWMRFVSKGRDNVAPELIPWEGIQYLVASIAYGGKVDRSEDLDILQGLARDIFTRSSFDANFTLVEGLAPPEGKTIDSYVDWIKALPLHNSPTWIGLEENVEDVLQALTGRRIAGKVVELSI